MDAATAAVAWLVNRLVVGVMGVSDGAGALDGVASGVALSVVGAGLGAFRCSKFMRNLVGSVMVLINCTASTLDAGLCTNGV